ncbi:MAG: Ig-like domain-containing protein [Gemmatimonadota bacterium]
MTHWGRGVARSIGFICLAMVGMSCGPDTMLVAVDEGDEPPPPYRPPTVLPTIGTILITHEPDTTSVLAVGSTLQMFATALDGEGNFVSTPGLAWRSLTPFVATVSSTGLLTAASVGTAPIVVVTGCCGADTVFVAVELRPPPPPWVQITPNGGTIPEIGVALELTATARVTEEQVVVDPGLSWTSFAPHIATVDGNGRVTGKSAGTALIAVAAECCGTDTVAVTVRQTLLPPSPYFPPPADGSVWFEETWAGYSSLPQYGSAPGIHWAQNSTIETGTLFDGSTGRFVRSRYPGNGGDGTAGVAVSPTLATTDRPREIWGEVYFRVPSDWSIKSDDKTLFVMEDWRNVPGSFYGGGEGEVWRWAIYLRNNSGYGGPYFQLVGFENQSNLTSQMFTGQWVRLRYHFKMASNMTATDGIYEVWVGDRKVTSRVGIRTDSHEAAFFRVHALGVNADPNGSAERDWGRLRIYASTPGW